MSINGAPIGEYIVSHAGNVVKEETVGVSPFRPVQERKLTWERQSRISGLVPTKKVPRTEMKSTTVDEHKTGTANQGIRYTCLEN